MLGVNDHEREEDQYSFKILLEIANELDSDIQFTWEVSSEQIDSRFPVLDLGLQVVNNKIPHFMLTTS